MERIFAGGVVFLALIILADYDSTAPVAVAFAYLVLLSATMAVGPVAFARVSAAVGAGPVSDSTVARRSGGRPI